ncbi:hypothetical protein EJB05_16894, partial [Eragrostis curvula]
MLVQWAGGIEESKFSFVKDGGNNNVAFVELVECTLLVSCILKLDLRASCLKTQHWLTGKDHGLLCHHVLQQQYYALFLKFRTGNRNLTVLPWLVVRATITAAVN